jgi:ABC-type cobalamin/Fe3+-siderophores transport system ATPase subunit
MIRAERVCMSPQHIIHTVTKIKRKKVIYTVNNMHQILSNLSFKYNLRLIMIYDNSIHEELSSTSDIHPENLHLQWHK